MAAKGDPSDREIVLSRVFEFPRELVFKAWIEPEHFKVWMGPPGWGLNRRSFHRISSPIGDAVPIMGYTGL